MKATITLPVSHERVVIDVPEGLSLEGAVNEYFKNHPDKPQMVFYCLADEKGADEQTIRNIAAHNLEHDIERVIIAAATNGINLNTIADTLQAEAAAMRRVARMVKNLNGGDTWP